MGPAEGRCESAYCEIILLLSGMLCRQAGDLLSSPGTPQQALMAEDWQPAAAHPDSVQAPAHKRSKGHACC